jgi:hypothetical protein
VPAGAASKAEGVRELLLALSVAVERGELPERLSSSLPARHLEELIGLMSRCLSKVMPNAV